MFRPTSLLLASAIFGSAVVASAAAASAGTLRFGDAFSEPTITVGKTHVMRPRSRWSLPARYPLSGLLPYNGGLVERFPKIYLIYWGFGKYGDPSGEAKYLTNFMTGVGGSSWLNTVTQYYDAKGNIKNPSSQLAGVWNYNTIVPSGPSDSQIQAVAQRGVKHFGYNPNATYFVMTPTGHNTGGFGTQFCAYHGAFSSGGHVVAYTNMPYITDAGQACGQNFVNSGPSGLLDGVSIVAGHEQAEAITDPNPPSGWSGNYGEIGDLCAWASNSTDISLSTGSFAVQPLWSDVNNNCVTSY